MSDSSIDGREVFWLGGAVWEVAAGLRDALFDRSRFLLPNWLAGGQATRIKSGPGRSMYHVQTGSHEFYIKHFRSPSGWTGWRHRLREGRAAKEYRLAGELNRAGIRTVCAVAMGEATGPGHALESYVVTHAIPDGVPMKSFVEEQIRSGQNSLPASERRRMIRQLAHLVATLHEAGFEHRDLHERNLIVQPTSSGHQLYLLDLHELRERRVLSTRQMTREMTRLGRYFSVRVHRSDRARFFRDYARHRGWSEAVRRLLTRSIEAATIESRADFWRRRDERPLERRSRVRTFHGPGIWGSCDEGVPDSWIEFFTRGPENALRTHAQHWFKRGRRTEVAAVKCPQSGLGTEFLVKRYVCRPIREALASLFREPPALRAWRNGHSLRLREIRTPRPLFVMTRRQGGLPREAVLVTELVRGARSARAFVDAAAKALEPAALVRWRTTFVAAAARFLRQMHERRVTHPDLKASNILVTIESWEAEPNFWLVDLDGVRTWRRVPRSRKVQNIARCWLSFHDSAVFTRTDRIRFLRMYLGPDAQDDWKKLWRAVDRAARRKIRRNARRGRVLA